MLASAHADRVKGRGHGFLRQQTGRDGANAKPREGLGGDGCVLPRETQVKTHTKALGPILAVALLSTRASGAGPVDLPFVALSPCRLVDTRGNGAPLTGGFLAAATVRSYTLVGVCSLPPDARAVALNATVTDTTGPGFLVLWPKGGSLPSVSTLNFVAGQTVANAAVVPLSSDGSISVTFGVSGGDVILDITGYFSPTGIVTGLNGLTGSVRRLSGANVPITSGGGTFRSPPRADLWVRRGLAIFN